jgi:hypothetical protein
MGGVMTHKQAAKAHFRRRFIERYGRAPSLKETDDIRLALKHKRCFWCQDCGSTIRGIVPFGNIYVTAVYNKRIDGMVTAGCPLTGEKK